MNTNQIEIVLVEDNKDDATLAIRALKKHNLANKLIHLKDGEEALEFFFSKSFESLDPMDMPKVLLLDLKMPKVDGIEVLQKLKSNPNTKSIPIVILTSSAEDPDIDRCYALGANSYIVKPVKFDDFTKTVAQLGMYWMVLNRPTAV